MAAVPHIDKTDKKIERKLQRIYDKSIDHMKALCKGVPADGDIRALLMYLSRDDKEEHHQESIGKATGRTRETLIGSDGKKCETDLGGGKVVGEIENWEGVFRAHEGFARLEANAIAKFFTDPRRKVVTKYLILFGQPPSPCATIVTANICKTNRIKLIANPYP